MYKHCIPKIPLFEAIKRKVGQLFLIHSAQPKMLAWEASQGDLKLAKPNI